MSIEDIKGYRPHTEDKIGKVNAIKDAEVRLGLIFKTLDEELTEVYVNSEGLSENELDQALSACDAMRIAKEKLKEASMWACRAVFQPEEKY
ncbi:hypothetical protein AU156_gp122 [Edwardsiella phage PEi20]|uniref:Acb2/Tad1 hairpin domain-containing protein n=1 Tax=Edwardsiella phage PEi20 TaxID=1608310 RepID=A0A0B6VL24_9CAUD|nr:hypothetical protein AU156_gp122 [Edwardsiella phage PEi20]BAQ22772.1 conserved hypothetical protein [Edwardsiella phage PEi20]